MAYFFVAFVEICSVGPGEPLHKFSHIGAEFRISDEMDMVWHKAVTIEQEAEFSFEFS